LAGAGFEIGDFLDGMGLDGARISDLDGKHGADSCKSVEVACGARAVPPLE
jgi:hypothetical protein